jgi:hypothetical protein
VLFLAATGKSASLTAIALLVLAAIMFTLVLAIVWLVVSIRAATGRAQASVTARLRAIERQVAAGYRPLLVDVLRNAPVPDGMGAVYDVASAQGPTAEGHGTGPVIKTSLPGMGARFVDPRTVFVLFEGGKIFLSVPLRNVGPGLAVIDGDGIELTGPLAGELEYRRIQRRHVPPAETTRIDLIVGESGSQNSDEAMSARAPMIAWELAVPYMDFAGEQRMIATFHIVCRGEQLDGPWLVEQVDQGPAPEDERQTRDRPGAASAPTPTTAGRPQGAKQQPLTDMWGNPIRPR